MIRDFYSCLYSVNGSGCIIPQWFFLVSQITSYLAFLLKLHTSQCKESTITIKCSPMYNLHVSHMNISKIHQALLVWDFTKHMYWLWAFITFLSPAH